MKPIDTPYSGHLFRSRLEARWAVLFDCLNLGWEYEPEGFRLSDGTHYLPDFRVFTPQGMAMWIEVKPHSIKDSPKFNNFAESVRYGVESCRTALVSGTPLQWVLQGDHFCPRCGVPIEHLNQHVFGKDWGYLCFDCDLETPCGGGHGEENTGVRSTGWYPHKGSVCLSQENMLYWRGLVRAAAETAQQVRFEHGALTKRDALLRMYKNLYV